MLIDALGEQRELPGFGGGVRSRQQSAKQTCEAGPAMKKRPVHTVSLGVIGASRADGPRQAAASWQAGRAFLFVLPGSPSWASPMILPNRR
ncbi:hypothetical protein GCM10017624_09930 [Azotobacter vinelandii]|nr:hypothetical protein GCM10017624_09930 [Azotobacter vinelandii]